MDVSAINTQSNQISKAQQTLSGNYETFLRLLTTQLQNQDPLEPLDATKFTEQLVSYSQVEQQIATNSNLSSLIALTKAAAGANAITYLGKTAFTAGPNSSLSDGEAAWRYTLPRDAALVQLNITDLNGHLVKSLTGETATGAHDLIWDGKNTAGTTMPEGSYRLSIVAKTPDGRDIPAGISGQGFVHEIDMSAAEPIVLIGARKVKLSEIIGLKNER